MNVNKKQINKDFNKELRKHNVNTIIKLYNYMQKAKNNYGTYITKFNNEYFLKIHLQGYFKISENSIYNFITFDKFIKFVEIDLCNIIDIINDNDLKEIDKVLDIYNNYIF